MWGSRKKNRFEPKRYRIIRPKVKYNNPLTKSRRKFELKPIKVINFFLLVGILVFMYFFVFSNFYNITDVQVSGNQVISTDDVLDITNQYLDQRTLLIFKNRNIFIFNKNVLKKRINEVVILNDLKVNKILPNVVSLTLTEKNSAIKWLTNDKEYLVDTQGQIIKQYYASATPALFNLNNGNVDPEAISEPTEAGKFIKIRDLANQAVVLGDYVLKPENVELILDLEQKLGSFDYLKLKEVEVPNIYPQYINLMMVDDWQLQFNLQDTLEAQMKRLSLLIDQKIKPENLNMLEYIDLRLGESIYYKYKGQE